MKKIFNILIVCMLTISISYAQERGPRQNRTPEDMAKMQLERFTKELSLSSKQQDSIYKYTLKASIEQRKIMETAGENREAAFEKMRSMRENNDKIIKSFLNADQVKIYDELAKSRPQGQGRRNN